MKWHKENDSPHQYKNGGERVRDDSYNFLLLYDLGGGPGGGVSIWLGRGGRAGAFDGIWCGKHVDISIIIGTSSAKDGRSSGLEN